MGELIRREAAVAPVAFSGERLTAAISGQVEIEHYHRYLLAREFCRGRDVLDVAAGEGYGTALLAQVARSAVGVEIDPASVDAARREFVKPNLRYEQGDARALTLPDASVDVAVSFETLEHLAEQDVFLTELRRVLRPDGMLIISTPDRDVYSPIGAPPNPYHVLELTRGEFSALLGRHFAHHAVAGQRAIIGSVILEAGAGRQVMSFEKRSQELIEATPEFSRAQYLVAFASNVALPALPQSVYIARSDLDTDMQVRLEAERRRIEAEAEAVSSQARADAAAAAAAQAREESARALQAAEARAAAADSKADIAEAAMRYLEDGFQDANRRTAHAEAQAEQALQDMAAGQQAFEVALQAAVAEAAAAMADSTAAQAESTAAKADSEAAGRRAAVSQSETRHAARVLAQAEADAQAASRLIHAQEAELNRLRAIEWSSIWRATRPLRAIGRRIPGLAVNARRAVKLVWWTATLQLPRRYRLWRAARWKAPVLPAPPPAIAPAPPVESIVIASAVAPEISIIIASYGQVAVTLACLKSIADYPPGRPFEVLLMNDAYPGPEDISDFERVRGIRLLRNKRNLGFLRSCNEAAKAARGKFLFLLNNDTELRPGTVDELTDLLESRPDAGMAGAKLLFPDGTLQEAGGILWSDGSGWNYGRGQDPARPEFNYVREADYCSGAALMLRRDLFAALGGFDEHFAPAYYEDSDLAFRIRARGLKMLYQPRAEVVHHEGVTHGTDVATGVKAHQVTNQARFLARWGEVLRTEHFANAEHVPRARDRARRKNVILVIDHYVPEPDRDAGSRSALGIIGSLMDDGWVVKFWPHNRAYSQTYTVALEQLGIEVVDHRWPGDLAAWLREAGDDVDHVLVIRPTVAVDVLPAIEANSKALVSFYGVDLHCARMRRAAALNNDAALAAEADEMEMLERDVWRRCDSIIYPSEEEAREVRAMAPGLPVHGIIAFHAEPDRPRQTAPGGRRILFVAGFAHPPNVDAALFLINDVLPGLRRVMPDVEVILAGSNPTEAVRALAGPGVTVTGYVTDFALRELYETSRAAVVPLRFGAGVKGKVVEALSHGLPLVTTSTGAQGIPGLDGVIPVRDDAAGLAAALRVLLEDDAAWLAQSAAQLAFAGEKFSREAMRRSVLAAMPV